MKTSEGLRTVVELDPIALRVLATIEFRAQAEGGILRFPPEVRTEKILMCALKQAIIREAHLQPLLGQIEAASASSGALRSELRIRRGSGEIGGVGKGILSPGNSGTAKLPTDAKACGHETDIGADRTVLEIADPDGC